MKNKAVYHKENLLSNTDISFCHKQNKQLRLMCKTCDDIGHLCVYILELPFLIHVFVFGSEKFLCSR